MPSSERATTSSTGRRAHRGVVGWLFENRTTGEFTVAQFPNAPLWVAAAGATLARFLVRRGTTHAVVSVTAGVALAWWAVDEILRGVNPFRRLLGIAVAAAVAAVLLRH